MSARRGSRAAPGGAFAGVLRALCGRAAAAAAAARAALALAGPGDWGVRIDKAAQEEVLRACFAEAAARRRARAAWRARGGGGGPGRLDEQLGFAGPGRSRGPDRLAGLLGFAPAGRSREQMTDLLGFARRPVAGERRREALRDDREIGR